MNLDGGGSTTLYVRGKGVINALQEGVARAVGHAIVFRKKAVINPVTPVGYADDHAITYGDLRKLGLVK